MAKLSKNPWPARRGSVHRTLATLGPVFLGLALWMGSLGWAPAAAGDELSPRELKRLQKQAGKAFNSGQLRDARKLYVRLLDGTSPGDLQRADGLYALAMIYLAPEPAPRDEVQARQHLDELAEYFPSHPRRLEIAAARSWLADLDKARAGVQAAANLLAAKQEALDQARQEAAAAQQEQEQESAAASAEAGDRVRSLAAQLRKTQAELEETQAELAKKEEALEKLRDALVSRAGGSG